MARFDQIVTLQLGQSGLQIGSAFWELICIEHAIAPDGEPLITDGPAGDYDNATSLFDLGNRGQYIPRSIFVDSEPSVIDDIKSGAYKNLFNKVMMTNEFEDAANNYARGSYTLGRKMIGKISNIIRKTAEHTDNLRSFFIFNSTGGGTGSGLSPLILLTLIKDFPKITRSAFSIVPGSNYVSAIVEPYNMMLHNFAVLETLDINFLLDNESIYDICCKKLYFNSPSYTEINRILALMLSSISSPLRYSTTLRSSMDDMLTNLIPYTRIHYPIVRYAPLNHKSRTTYDKITTADLTKELFSKDNQSLKIDTNRGLYISIMLNYQGLVNHGEIYKAIDHHKTNNPNQFVEWAPTGFKIGIYNQLPTMSPMSQISQTDQSATMLMNSTAIHQFFKTQILKFDLLYQRKAFVHWYLGEGMEEVEFNEARDENDVLVRDLHEIEMSEKEIVENMEAGNPRKSRSISVRQQQSENETMN